VDCHTLEGVYTKFNLDHPPFHRGHSLSVSDIVQVLEAPELVGRIKFYNEFVLFNDVSYIDSGKYNAAIANAHEEGIPIFAFRLTDHHVPSVEPGCYFCDSAGFKKIDFDPSSTYKPKNLLRVVAKEPDKPAYEAEIADNLRAFKQAVQGDIETSSPVDKNTVIICNRTGLVNGMNPNCIINENIYFGTIFAIGYDGKEDFCSLTDEQTQKYLELYNHAEIPAIEEQAQNGGIIWFN
jgi:hypothetical protein